MRIVVTLALALAATGGLVGAMPEAGQTQAQAQTRTQVNAMQRISYGDDRLQGILYWPAARAGAPLVMIIHGGGWSRGDMRMMQGSAKLSHWQAQGYAVASVNYRLVPDATVEQQAGDVAAALAYMKDDAALLRFDANRIALSGHSAGAHLAALVGTDPQYLRAAGLSLAELRGVLALDGAAYNVPDQMDENVRSMGDTYRAAFGTNPARQRALSPTFHASGPNAPDFLILHVQRADAARQSEALGAALEAAGTRAEVRGFAGRGLRGHREINARLGDPDYPATAVVDAWLAQVLR